jgi:hypothetical protein
LTVAGAAGLLGLHASPIATELPSETTTLRLMQVPSIDQAPQDMAEEWLRCTGSTTVHYVKTESLKGSSRHWPPEKPTSNP